MDLVYISEVFTYGYSRNPQYRDYEQPWNRDYFKCSSKVKKTILRDNFLDKVIENLSKGKSVENQRIEQQQSKESCHLCKEMKRRNLAVYIRSKSRSDSCHEGIHEEEEENDIVMYNEKKAADADRNKSAKSSRGAEKS